MKNTVAILTLTILATACGAFVPVKNLRELTPEQKHAMNSVRIVNQAQLQGQQFEIITFLEGHSCQNMITDPPATRAAAVDQIKYLANEAGANAISNVQCGGREGTSVSTNCWELISCTAEAIRMPVR